MRIPLGSSLVVLVSIALIGCSENPSSPKPGAVSPQLNSAKPPKLELKEGNRYSLVVNSDIELYDKKGKLTKKLKHTANVDAEVIDGRLAASVHRGFMTNVSMSTNSFQDPVPDSINMMPVLGVATDEYASTYNDTESDGEGHNSAIVGTSSTSGYPVNLVNAYLNDTLVAKVSMVWQPVTGGFSMATQIQKAYDPEGNMVALVWSTPDYSTITIQEQRSIPFRFARSIETGLERVACALGPSVAYAGTTSGMHVPAPMMYSCGYRITLFAGETFVLGGGAATIEITGPVGVAIFLTGWGLWTAALHDMLHCLR
jgi:hypothetical protein